MELHAPDDARNMPDLGSLDMSQYAAAGQRSCNVRVACRLQSLKVIASETPGGR